jgi:type VI secretion system protein ImpC
MATKPTGGEEKPAAAAETKAAPAAATDILGAVIAESQKAGARDQLKALLERAISSGVSQETSAEKKKTVRNAIQLIEGQIKTLDQRLSAQINEILHNARFQTLEGTWRGLKYLVSKSDTGTMLKIRVLHAEKGELLKDIENASDFDQSRLFKLIYESEYGTYGGAPYSVLVGGYEFTKSNADLDLLMGVSNIAAAAHAPFLSAAHADLFGLKTYEQLGDPRDLAKLFETNMEKWNQFRSMEDSRYVGLTLPRMLMRLPYGKATEPVDGFDFEEDVDGTNSNKYLWGSAAFALGQRITNAFSLHKWCAAIRGAEGGGMVEGLPLHKFRTDEGDIATKVPTEVSITDRREKELSDLGFIPLVFCKNTNYATFFGAPTANKPKTFDTDSANANARISSQLPYILAASRFAHYLKVIVRDKIGSFMTRDDVSAHLNRWIMQYVLGRDDAGQDLKAKFPLRDARVDVYDVPGKPGAYRAVVYVRPHFQLDELSASIRLVADLPPPAG